MRKPKTLRLGTPCVGSSRAAVEAGFSRTRTNTYSLRTRVLGLNKLLYDWAFLGTILTEGDFYANTLVTPIVAREAPAFLDSPLAGFLQVWLPFGFTVLAFSWLLLAVATIGTRVYSRTAS
jgi:hypothetical protein